MLCRAVPHRAADGVRCWRAPTRGRSLLRSGFAVLAGVNLAIGVFLGATQISVTAFAVEHCVAGAAATLFVVSGCASLLAG